MSALLELDGLMKRLDGEQGGGRLLFSYVSASIEAGEAAALIGASGQGKSTLLRCVSLLDKADEGEVRLEGSAQHHMEPRLWRMRVCYVAQQPVMLPGSVEHNLKTASMLHKTRYDEAHARRLMAALGLEYLDLNKQADELSGGEKQRVSLIRSLLLRPSVLLLDEITASLDANSKLLVEELLMGWRKNENTAQIWISHDFGQARRVCDSVWFMSGGTLLEQCESGAFFQSPATEEARRFIGMAAEPARAGDKGAAG